MRIHWLPLAVLLLIGLFVAGGIGLITKGLDEPHFWAGLAAGVTGTAVIAAVLNLLYESDGGRSCRLGDSAERDTFFALRRQWGWKVYWLVPFDGMDVDLVAIGRRGVVAFEVKATAVPWEITEQGFQGPISNPISQASGNAQKIRSLLRSDGGIVCNPIPALVVWGVVAWPDGRHVVHHGVHVVSPRRLTRWLKSLESESLSKEEVRQARATVDRYLKQLTDV